MARMEFRRDRHEGPVEIFDGEALEMLLHALGEAHAAEQTAAADREIEKPGDPPHGERAREALEFVELAGEIASADQRADRGAGDHADLDAGFVEGAEDADMRPAACRAATERQRKLRLLRDIDCNGFGGASGSGIRGRKGLIAATPTPVQHQNLQADDFPRCRKA